MMSAPFRRHIPVVVFTALLAAGCSGGSADAVRLEPREPVTDQSLVTRAREGLQSFGGGAFEVVDFKPVSGQRIGLTEYFYETRLYALEFDAQVRFSRDMNVRTPEESLARQGGPDWTRDEMIADMLRRNVLGAGRHPAGETKSLQAAAMFDDMEDGHRFRLIDRRFEGRTSLRRGTEGSR